MNFDERGRAILVEEEMIQAPAACLAGISWNPHLAQHQQPATRVFRRDLVAGLQFRVACQRFLMIGHPASPSDASCALIRTSVFPEGSSWTARRRSTCAPSRSSCCHFARA